MNDLDNVRDAVLAAISALGGLDILAINTPGHTEATFAARASNNRLVCAKHHYTINTLASVAAYEAASSALKVVTIKTSAIFKTAFLFSTHIPWWRLTAITIDTTHPNSLTPHTPMQASRGAVVCVSSIATQFTSVQDALFGYSGAKAALEAWAAGVAVEDGPSGVRINTVRPGVTMTAIWESAREAMGAGSHLMVMEAATTTTTPGVAVFSCNNACLDSCSVLSCRCAQILSKFWRQRQRRPPWRATQLPTQ